MQYIIKMGIVCILLGSITYTLFEIELINYKWSSAIYIFIFLSFVVFVGRKVVKGDF